MTEPYTNTRAIRSRGRRGSTVVPNWRTEDPALDPYDFRVAVWLASHADHYRADHVTRNGIARALGLSGERVTKSLDRLQALGVIEVERVPESWDGVRFRVLFDFTVWETDPVAARPTRSPDDQVPGRHTTTPPVATRPGPGRHTTATRGEQGETHQENTGTADVEAVDAEIVPLHERQFADWWAAYPSPRRIDKAACARKFAKLTDDERLAALEGLRRWLASWDDVRFVPNTTTWLNQRRWETEPPPRKAGSTGKSAPGMDRLRAMMEQERGTG